MSALTEPTAEHVQADDHAHGHDGHVPSDRHFIVIALWLALLTALETSTYWIDLGGFATPLLLIMMTIKFIMIVLVFMHLKYDHKLLSVFFYMGLVLAIVVYSVFLATFQFFDR
ncbi:MAG TPA: cytochrome C oxidase subunit IV family protein [Ilumatobacteraceae bacterium]|nr:cytochrome C oxidase subunit IV family protein [Ilumatobacteraceae bacterium]